jgi:TatD DNase family protein
MIDTHAHIYLPQFKESILEVLERAVQVGITDIVLPAIHEVSWEEMNSLPQVNAIRFHKLFGIHPCDVDKDISTYEKLIRKYAELDDTKGIGETGLDYYWSKERIEQQKKSLNLHCELAKELGKPIVLHNRESTDDLLQIVEKQQDGRLTGVWHCFNGSIDEGKRAIDLGLKLGLGGVITFKNGGMDKVIPHLPLNAFILETDSPYLAPTPFRGKQNEPSFITKVAEKLAELHALFLDDVVETTSTTAKTLFNL